MGFVGLVNVVFGTLFSFFRVRAVLFRRLVYLVCLLRRLVGQFCLLVVSWFWFF